MSHNSITHNGFLPFVPFLIPFLYLLIISLYESLILLHKFLPYQKNLFDAIINANVALISFPDSSELVHSLVL